VNEAPRQPILATLSEGEKDALILRLWDDLCEARARSQALQQALRSPDRETIAGGQDAVSLLAQLQKHGTDKHPAPATSSSKPRLGGFGFLRAKAVLGALALVALAFAADYAVGAYQRAALERSRAARRQLEQAANAGLFVELANVAYEPDGKSYRVTMVMRNLEPSHEGLWEVADGRKARR
jgi:hypothetical protein